MLRFANRLSRHDAEAMVQQLFPDSLTGFSFTKKKTEVELVVNESWGESSVTTYQLEDFCILRNGEDISSLSQEYRNFMAEKFGLMYLKSFLGQYFSLVVVEKAFMQRN